MEQALYYRILVIDSQILYWHILRQVMVRFGDFSIDYAMTPAQAQEKMENDHYDLVILEPLALAAIPLEMQDEFYEFCENSQISLILFSILSHAELSRFMLHSLALASLSKPCNYMEFGEVVTRLLLNEEKPLKKKSQARKKGRPLVQPEAIPLLNHGLPFIPDLSSGALN